LRLAAREMFRERRGDDLRVGVRRRVVSGKLQSTVADFAPRDGVRTIHRQILKQATTFSADLPVVSDNELGALAWGEIGDCALQLAAYDAATNAYAQVIASPFANISARKPGRKLVWDSCLEKKGRRRWRAAIKPRCCNSRCKIISTCFMEKIFTMAKYRTRFGSKRLVCRRRHWPEALGEWEQAANIYGRLEQKLPQLSELLENKIARGPGAIRRRRKTDVPFDTRAGRA